MTDKPGKRLCQYGARGALTLSRLKETSEGLYEYSPKRGRPFTLTGEELVKRLLALVPPPRRHLTSFHGVYAANSKLRALVTGGDAPNPRVPPGPPTPEASLEPPKPPSKRIDWATLHRCTFGNEVLRCPKCGGPRRVKSMYETPAAALDRLKEIGVPVSPPLKAATSPPRQAQLAV